ncbi:TrmH family RNA methyltransferase [Arcanobacterium bovis]|uniref:RNA methyltransferase n=1 Tax=Arcanobacterium bovis TaxID=2529275 RepID=A0A4Q9V1L1_9ACTO|nr:RNA methyltransferase [Arcanobacterium bovis]TBW22994.1 RNA methyltransferase [Arcanobacterium bovis]
MIIELNDLNDSRLDDFIRLTDVALRKKLETERGLYLAEGIKVIERSLEAGHRPRAILAAPRWLTDIQAMLERVGECVADIPIFVTSIDDLEQITGYRIHRGAMASMNRPPLVDVETFLQNLGQENLGQGPARIFVLEDLVDHTNVGAIFRSAAALGIDGILVTQSCADPLYRRSVKVSMGNVFQIPWTRINNWPRSIETLHENGWITASLALREDAKPLSEFAALPEVRDPNSKIAIVLGTEGDGLSSRTIASTHHSVVIPMARQVDSLNVASAGALAAWELRIRN